MSGALPPVSRTMQRRLTVGVSGLSSEARETLGLLPTPAHSLKRASCGPRIPQASGSAASPSAHQSPKSMRPVLARLPVETDLEQADGSTIVANLVAENGMLREELARSTATPMMHRRRAAIAGGGFKGSAIQDTPQRPTCSCDLLKAKLQRALFELQQARSAERAVSSTSPRLANSNKNAPELPSLQDIGIQTAVCTQLQQQRQRQQSDAEVQAGQRLSDNFLVERAVQTSQLVFKDAAAQARTFLLDAASETQSPPHQEVAVQVAICGSSNVTSVQLQASPAVCEMITQTENRNAPADVGTQVAAEQCCAEVQCELAKLEVRTGGSDAMRECSMQTDHVNIDVQRPQWTQTPPLPDLVVASVQTLRAVCTDQSSQANDDTTKARLAEVETQVAALEALAVDRLALCRQLEEDMDGWRQLAQKQLLGHINVTILCPRAECTVNGDHLEMDSWNPTKLKEDFEREVLPRFTRMFLEESREKPLDKNEQRMKTVEKLMTEFADTFRSRLTAMLSNPNAVATTRPAAR